ncbi:MAG: DUF4389 domain-containing protein [Dehalococcoidia bacterium]|nr:MAG: DUF4389 domain-containing protein [Dehalococcoidia bacterium]
MADEAVAYPVTYDVEPQIAERNRLTVAFRFILAIPHLLLVGGPGFGLGVGSDRTGVLGTVAAVAAIINWFIIVFTGRANEGLLSLQQYYLRWRARALAYEALLRDEYPPFGDGDYPVSADFPAVIEGRNRWTVGFRLLLAIPQAIVLFFVLIAWVVTAIIGWFAVLFTGRYPNGLWQFGQGAMRWTLRVEAYLLLLRDEYPPFSLQ